MDHCKVLSIHAAILVLAAIASKVLEDTDRDGSIDTVTVFAEGLNIPSGIAVGHGGVWVAGSPDILFLQDTDNDGKADTREVVVTGCGRFDTHELPNSLTWGPDGWLYGLNGVFNPSTIEQKKNALILQVRCFVFMQRLVSFKSFARARVIHGALHLTAKAAPLSVPA